MGIQDSIKEERKLSFNNWRYRILHWTFNVKNPDPNKWEDTELPQCFYTHYCPLFHLTNLIAIFSPLILLTKIGVLVARAFWMAFVMIIGFIPFEPIFDYLDRIKSKMTEKKPQEKKEITLEDEKDMCIKLVQYFYDCPFETFWNVKGTEFQFITKEQAKIIFDKQSVIVAHAKRRAELRKKKWRENIIFWTNFSRVFVKWIMNIAYVGLALLVLYFGYEVLSIVWTVLCWIGGVIYWLFSNESSVDFLLFMGKFFLFSGLCFVVVFVLFKFKIAQKFLDVIVDGVEYINPPFYIFWVPIRWVRSGWKNTMEFISMFYEQNCPPIKLISKEEAIIESIAREGEEV